MTLTSEQMLAVDKGFLVKHKLWVGVWVVMERDIDLIRCISVNTLTSGQIQVAWNVDDINLSLFEVPQGGASYEANGD